TAHPGDALADGTAADVPVLIGCTRDEATLFLAADEVFRKPELLDDDTLRSRIGVLGEGIGDNVIDPYRRAMPDAAPLDVLIAIQSDAFMRIPSIRFSEHKLEGGGRSPVYMYFFCWAAGVLRSSHGYEIPFVFDNIHEPVIKPSASRHDLADRMS